MKKFEKIFIEITNFCGLSCSFCVPPKSKDKMSLQDFDILCAKISPFTQLCALHILGDPMALKNLDSYLEIANQHSLKIDLTTSGIYLNQDNISMLLQTPCIHQLNISLTSILYQKTPQDLKSYLQKVFLLCQIHSQTKSQKFINLRLWNLNKDSTPPLCNQEIYALLKEHFQVKLEIPKTRLAYKIHLIQQPFFEWASLDLPEISQEGFCYGGSKQLGILCDGDVVPCCFDTKGEIKLGNILKNSLQEILQSKRARDLILGFQANKCVESLCQHCSYPKYLSARSGESL